MSTGIWYEFSRQILIDFDALAECVSHSTGRHLYGFNVDFRNEGCRIVLKAYTNKRSEIAFVNASTAERVIEVLDAFLHTNGTHGVEWRPDKYYKEINLKILK